MLPISALLPLSAGLFSIQDITGCLSLRIMTSSLNSWLLWKNVLLARVSLSEGSSVIVYMNYCCWTVIDCVHFSGFRPRPFLFLPCSLLVSRLSLFLTAYNTFLSSKTISSVVFWATPLIRPVRRSSLSTKRNTPPTVCLPAFQRMSQILAHAIKCSFIKKNI